MILFPIRFEDFDVDGGFRSGNNFFSRSLNPEFDSQIRDQCYTYTQAGLSPLAVDKMSIQRKFD